MSAPAQPNQIAAEIERELARRLDVAKQENRPAEVLIAGHRYRLVLIEAELETTDGPVANYDPWADFRAEREQGMPAAEDVRAAKGTLHKHFGSVTPHHRPEDFAALREEFERGVAEDARTRGQK